MCTQCELFFVSNYGGSLHEIPDLPYLELLVRGGEMESCAHRSDTSFARTEARKRRS